MCLGLGVGVVVVDDDDLFCDDGCGVDGVVVLGI